MKEIKWCVYIHVNKINKKVYIGQTSQKPERRWGKNGYNYKKSSYFELAIQKYGWDNFEHIILKDNLTQEEANYWEKYYIEQYDSTNRDRGYNLTTGGNNFKVVSEETRKKLSDAKKGSKNSMYGHIYSQEERKKLSQIQLERYKNPEERKKTGQAMKKYYQTPGAKEKQKQTIRKSIGKSVQCIETGEVFECICDAAKWCNLSHGYGIGQCCIGKAKSAGKHPITKEKLHWRYTQR